MAKYKTIRVYPSGPVWMVKKDSAAKASAVKNTKEEALRVARDFAINQGLTIIIHGRDGKIQRTLTPQQAESQNDCFITTACVNHYGLSDDCVQLQSLRNFRDNYLLKSGENQLLVQQYYSLAPVLVDLLESDVNKEKLYKKIFGQINSSCSAIQKNEMEKAKNIYINAVLYLMNYFKME